MTVTQSLELSPREWGCTVQCHSSRGCGYVVPTRVGVYRGPAANRLYRRSCPHASGGVPETGPFKALLNLVVPTRVGVYLKFREDLIGRYGCPHASGGVPQQSVFPLVAITLSPREWGCTGSGLIGPATVSVVPTRVGVYLYGLSCKFILYSCPHASGGVPQQGEIATIGITLSPREWGCTGPSFGLFSFHCVVPTRVGVYRLLRIPPGRPSRCPHASGGVPCRRFTPL